MEMLYLTFMFIVHDKPEPKHYCDLSNLDRILKDEWIFLPFVRRRKTSEQTQGGVSTDNKNVILNRGFNDMYFAPNEGL